ncbi:GNAT family N-acetyltransferase [Allorhodopirellula heiligendammensis]|uniref:Acetyltransferase n=1 Tax=Allorhodopirellula heiligendammensis TaxID=2714739 RepID=A0A5C6C598_9BACT|nr:GNAT family N-acetyltransferase [Allorhodopirellula heiligendammensis]TWU19275.1 putative acetyltransferase [Allorhodopirellula heiligendammensis]
MKFIEIEWCSPEYQSALELRHEVLRAPLGLKLTAEELDGEHGQLHFGVAEGDELIATLVARPHSTNLVQLRQIAVHPNRQSSGVGRFLMEYCEANLRERGFQEITLNARLITLPFYEKLGYEAVGDVFKEITLEHQKMVKQIGGEST